jgi:signal peptidase I
MKVQPRLITDTLGYNSHDLYYQARSNFDRPAVYDRTPGQDWVGDLMLECQVQVREPKGELYFELSKGMHRFQARWDLSSGTCTLYKISYKDGKLDKTEEMGTAPTGVRAGGSYLLRLANVDARLTAWVDGELPFQDGVTYPPPEVRGPDDNDKDVEARRGPTVNDLQPASIGSKGAHVEISDLRLWRDTYFTTQVSGADIGGGMSEDDWANPEQWQRFKQQTPLTMYVQPGHYLAMGDNSPNSSDSREWGVVPERLLLGRALVVYYPFQRAGAIR